MKSKPIMWKIIRKKKVKNDRSATGLVQRVGLYSTPPGQKLSSLSVEVTMKISIPQYRRINSGYICMIDGAQHEIYNAAHVTTKDGFKETELTLKTPTIDREVIEDDTEGTE